MKKNHVAEPTADEMRSHYDFDYSKSRPNRFAARPKLGRRDGHVEIEAAPREVRVVRKGRMRVAVPIEEGAPLRSDAVRETTASTREHRR
ncbi:MAG: hypothetical protein QOI58_4366 [Thermoanaerobaculia bacterium]|jgi:hypothetical protein|nr:hypothetical protein [Thermoanaerobaculia bacterium]